MKLTPGMQQYMEQKKIYPDCIILFRMGDFYETFYDDAKICSKVLGITLTGRGKDETRAPLAGIPFHALDNYLHKLVNAGYKVAICEQLEDPKLTKKLVKRGVVRVVTPGTLIDEKCLDKSSNNYIASVFLDEGVSRTTYGFSVCDISTGEFLTSEFESVDKLLCEFAKYSPSEILLCQDDEKIKQYCEANGALYNKVSISKFLLSTAKELLQEHFHVHDLISLGLSEHELSICASGALLSYLFDTQMTSLDHISRIRYYKQSEYMILDASTIRNLELLKNISDGSKRGSLLSVLDKTITPLGSRMMKNWIIHPILDVKKINDRLFAVKTFFEDVLLREETINILREIADLERIIGRVEYGIANARDLVSLRESFLKIPKLKGLLLNHNTLSTFVSFDDFSYLTDLLSKAIKDEPSAITREGHMIKEGYNKELDDLFHIKRDGAKILQEIERKEKEETKIPSLKIGYNNVFGYYIEVTTKYKDQVPSNYIRKQTLSNYERFITEELKIKEEQLLCADEKIVELEYKLFCDVVLQVRKFTRKIQDAANTISVIDCLLSFAIVSSQNRYVCPNVSENFDLVLLNARHAVIETMRKNYISNDCKLSSEASMMIITGPNMSGKSSYMRQTALCALMAQIGCFIPASSANIGVVDRIFTRVGAYDDLSSGQSTFMVEMNETSNILNNATFKSLIILDEIGRGTSTYDGIAIAWSVAEYIVKTIGAKCLFATHYHSMNELSTLYSNVKNFNVAVDEVSDEIVFLHKLIEGGTDKSYGIEVARLAGLPKDVIDNARQVMSRLEAEDEVSDRILQVQKVEMQNVETQRGQKKNIKIDDKQKKLV